MLLYLRPFRFSALFLSTLIHLSAQLAHTQMKDPWDDIQYRQPAGRQIHRLGRQPESRGTFGNSFAA